MDVDHVVVGVEVEVTCPKGEMFGRQRVTSFLAEHSTVAGKNLLGADGWVFVDGAANRVCSAGQFDHLINKRVGTGDAKRLSLNYPEDFDLLKGCG